MHLMPNLTLKNVPEQLLERLRAQAAANRRSVNSEILTLLDEALVPRKPDLPSMLAEISELHSQYRIPKLSAAEIRRAIGRGRL